MSARGSSHPDSCCVWPTLDNENVTLLHLAYSVSHINIVKRSKCRLIWYLDIREHGKVTHRVYWSFNRCKSVNCVCTVTAEQHIEHTTYILWGYICITQSLALRHPITSSFSHHSNDHHDKHTHGMVWIPGTGVGQDRSGVNVKSSH